MKQLFTTIIAILFSFTAAVAQENSADKAPKEKASKEEKASAKAQKEADQKATFNAAGFTSYEEELVKTSYANRSANTKALKADTSLSEEDVKTKSKEFSTSEDTMLKEKIGAAKYKAFKDAQKAQREAAKKE